MAQQSTQQYLEISEIKDNTLILKDGTLRAVVMCSSINFALKSEDEQNALIQGYMEFLNSLDFPIQIVVQSRKLDIENYINRLKDAQKKQTNDLLKNQVSSYLDFINELVDIGEIMTKKFFLVVPFNPAGSQAKGFFDKLKDAFSLSAQVNIKKEKFLAYKQELDLRVANIQAGLNSMSLDNAALDTQGLIELFFNAYNPKTSQNQKLRDINQLNIEEV